MNGLSKINKYYDRSFWANPFTLYLKWLLNKTKYQLKYWGAHLRIDYKAQVYNTVFGKYNYVAWYSVVTNSTVGDYTYIADYCRVDHLTIGKFCSIGPGVRIAPGKHPVNFISTHPSTYNNQQNLLRNFVDDNNYVTFAPVTDRKSVV